MPRFISHRCADTGRQPHTPFTPFTHSSHLHADGQRQVPHLQSRAVGPRIDGPREQERQALSRVARGVCQCAQLAGEVALAHLRGARGERGV